MKATERAIQNRIESIEETEAEIRSIYAEILAERDRLIRFLSGYSSPHHIIESLDIARSDIYSLEKKLMYHQERLVRDYKRLSELYREMEA
jgi:hypothetical protein